MKTPMTKCPRRAAAAIGFAGMLFITGAAQAQAPIARVNGQPIAAIALERAAREATAAGSADTPELRTALRNQLIARELFRQQAERQGLARDPEVAAAAEFARAQAFEQAMVQKYLRAAVRPRPIADADVQAHYERIVGALGSTEWKPRIIQTPDRATAQLVRKEMRAGVKFEDLAGLYSTAPSARAGGALDWVSFKTPVRDGATQGFPLPLAQALAALKPGQVSSEPINWNGALYFLRLDESRPTQVPRLDDVRAAIRAMLEQQELERATAALVTGLMQDARIE